MMFERIFFGYTMVYHGIPNFQTSRHRVIKPDSIRIRNETCPKICDATHLTAIYRWGELLFLAFISCWADVSHSILDLLILTGDRRYVQQKTQMVFGTIATKPMGMVIGFCSPSHEISPMLVGEILMFISHPFPVEFLWLMVKGIVLSIPSRTVTFKYNQLYPLVI